MALLTIDPLNAKTAAAATAATKANAQGRRHRAGTMPARQHAQQQPGTATAQRRNTTTDETKQNIWENQKLDIQS